MEGNGQWDTRQSQQGTGDPTAGGQRKELNSREKPGREKGSSVPSGGGKASRVLPTARAAPRLKESITQEAYTMSGEQLGEYYGPGSHPV